MDCRVNNNKNNKNNNNNNVINLYTVAYKYKKWSPKCFTIKKHYNKHQKDKHPETLQENISTAK